MPSQYNEDQFICEHFKGRKGRFLDIGAYDGLTFSNTRPLMELGWSGVCVEPNPLVFNHLVVNTECFPLIQSLQSAIVPDDFKHSPKMWVTQDALSTLVPAHRDLIQSWTDKVKYEEVIVPVLKWQEFLSINPEPFEFINIDVEGMNWEVLRDGPLAEMVCIEMDPAEEVPRMKEHFRIFGLTNQLEIGGNLLAWR